MNLHFKKDAEMLLDSQMEVLKGGTALASGSCATCCDKENGGVNTHPEEEEDEKKKP